jgi:hypothetical protein
MANGKQLSPKASTHPDTTTAVGILSTRHALQPDAHSFGYVYAGWHVLYSFADSQISSSMCDPSVFSQAREVCESGYWLLATKKQVYNPVVGGHADASLGSFCCVLFLRFLLSLVLRLVLSSGFQEVIVVASEEEKGRKTDILRASKHAGFTTATQTPGTTSRVLEATLRRASYLSNDPKHPRAGKLADSNYSESPLLTPVWFRRFPRPPTQIEIPTRHSSRISGRVFSSGTTFARQRSRRDHLRTTPENGRPNGLPANASYSSMAATGRQTEMIGLPNGVPVMEVPSPTGSDTSSTLSTTAMQEHGQGQDQPMLQPDQQRGGRAQQLHQHAQQASRSRSRARREPGRLALRTAFRNFSSLAEVVVGDDSDRSHTRTKFLIHKELLTAASPFFDAALNSTFAEGMDNQVKLPEEKPDSFEWFLQWLYTGSLTTPHARFDDGPDAAGLGGHHRHHGHHMLDHGGGYVQGVYSVPYRHYQEQMARSDGDLRNSLGSPKYFLLIDLYALSDRLLTAPLSNHILSTIARLSEATNSVPTPSDTFILYDNIPENSKLRMLVLDLFAYKKTDRLLETHKDEWHPNFLRALVVKLKRPGPEAIERHMLEAWQPKSWQHTKACEACKETLRPGISSDKCALCGKAFCGSCLRMHGGDPAMGGTGVLAHDASGCKPWTGRGMCARYHEHADGEVCSGMGM